MNTEENQLTEKERLAIIADIVKKVQSGEINPVLPEDLQRIEDEEWEQFPVVNDTEIEHGATSASQIEIEEERSKLGTEVAREIDFDNDENEFDMNRTSSWVSNLEKSQ